MAQIKRTDLPRARGVSTTLGKVDWFGTSSFEEAVRLAEHGWPDGLARIKTLSSKLKPLMTEQTERHISRFCEAGDEVDIGRYVTGEPECMVDYEMKIVPAAGRVVKILANVSASCGIDTEQMFMRGAAAVMLADLVEQSGLRSEIWISSAGHCYDGGPGKVDMRVCIKKPDQPLEMDRVAFMLANPSVFRRLMFMAYEQLTRAEWNKHIGEGYTLPCSAPTSNNEIGVDALQYGFGNDVTEENCAALVDAMIQRYMEPTVLTE